MAPGVVKKFVTNVQIRQVVKGRMKMRFYVFILSVILGFHSLNATALERSSVSSNSSTYESLRQSIVDLEQLKAQIDSSITAITACGNAGELFNLDGTCKGAVTENDPDVLNHSRQTTGDITNNCSADNRAQYYNGTNWACKLMAK